MLIRIGSKFLFNSISFDAWNDYCLHIMFVVCVYIYMQININIFIQTSFMHSLDYSISYTFTVLQIFKWSTIEWANRPQWFAEIAGRISHACHYIYLEEEEKKTIILNEKMFSNYFCWNVNSHLPLIMNFEKTF